MSGAYCHEGELRGEFPWKRGVCKNEMQTLQPDFDAERFFNGQWYEEQTIGSFFRQSYRKCCQFDSYLTGNVVNMTISEYIPVIFSTVRTQVQITLEDLKTPSFKAKIPWMGIAATEVQLNILGTDYDNYALLYSCSPALGIDGYISEMAFIIRRRWRDKSKSLEIRQLGWKNGIPFEDFHTTDNSACPVN